MFARALDALRPRPRIRSLFWFSRHIQTHQGKPYDHRAYPHIGAPGGPCDALDDNQVRKIWLMWASRLGKTFFGQAATIHLAGTRPGPMMFASASEKLALEVVDRTQAMIVNSPLREELPPPNRRNKSEIRLRFCRIHVAWARSAATLADKEVEFGHANEIEEWAHQSTSKDGDPLKQFEERSKQYSATRKLIYESIPKLKKGSRIEAGLRGSTDCRYWVPCPHCRRYQMLRLGDGKTPGGIIWDRAENGEHNKELARRTARYICRHCEGEIRDEHRAGMMRAGVWAPEGCAVNDAAAAAAVASWYTDMLGDAGGDGASVAADSPSPWLGWQACPWITGTPNRLGPEVGYQLSSLYSLQVTWGDIAAEYVAVKDQRQRLRNFVNQWLGETWAEIEVRHTSEQLGRLLADTYPRGTVPAAAEFLTAGVDVQEDGVYWALRAWAAVGGQPTSWLTDWGYCPRLVDGAGLSLHNSDLNQLTAKLLDPGWPVAGKTAAGYDQLWSAKICIDTGHRIHDVHQFLRAHPGDRLAAVAGDAYVRGVPFRASKLEVNARTGKVYEGGLLQWQLNVDGYKEDVRDRWNIPAGEPGAWRFPGNVLAEGLEYLRQVTNEAPHTDDAGRRKWKKVVDAWGNHYWDCEIYARAAADLVTGCDWSDPVAAAPAAAASQPSSGRRLNRRPLNRRR